MNFSIENLIYFYLFICVGMLIFNLLYMGNLVLKHKREEKIIEKMDDIIIFEMQCFQADKSIYEEHHKFLMKKLKNLNNLICYHKTIQKRLDQGDKGIQEYIKRYHDAFQQLAFLYGKKEDMQKAYYAYLMSVFQVSDDKEFTTLMEILLSYLNDTTVYCRENTLLALYSLGNSQAVVRAFQILDASGIYHHSKLLSDGLLKFSGDKKKLGRELWAQRQWNDNMKLAIITYLQNIDDSYCEEFHTILLDHQVGIEIRLAILRYYRRNVYLPVKKDLQELASHSDTHGTLIASISCSTLASYSDENTIFALKKALHDRNWYVRKNAAFSLISLMHGIEDIEDIITGDDAYARDMLNYALDENWKGGE